MNQHLMHALVCCRHSHAPTDVSNRMRTQKKTGPPSSRQYKPYRNVNPRSRTDCKEDRVELVRHNLSFKVVADLPPRTVHQNNLTWGPHLSHVVKPSCPGSFTLVANNRWLRRHGRLPASLQSICTTERGRWGGVGNVGTRKRENGRAWGRENERA